jgi:hypothetical protein
MALVAGRAGWSPGVCGYSELDDTLKKLGWEKCLLDGVPHYSRYDPMASRIGSFFRIEEIESKYRITAIFTDFEDFNRSFSNVIGSKRCIPTYVLRHIVGRADSMMEGRTDKKHQDIYLENRV